MATSNPFTLTLNKPARLFYTGQDDSDYNEGGNKGYASIMHYQILDMFNMPLKFEVPATEAFGPIVVPRDDLTSNWPQPDQEGNPKANPSDFVDEISASLGPHDTPPHMPPTLNPPKVLGMFKIDHWTDFLEIGSTTVGDGSFVESLTIQRFQDHGRHCAIQSPPGTQGNIPNPPGC
jgi:hypothetical protein